MHPLYLIDSSIYIFRAYFSMADVFFSKAGKSVNAVYGFTHFLLDLLIKTEPVYLSAAFDKSLTGCFRNELYPPYKANRELPDENLSYQLKKCQEFTALLGIHNLGLPDFEADDIIGTLKKKLGRNRKVVIVTRDKDLGQLIGKHDLMWDYADDKQLSAADIKGKFGVYPHQIADFLALAGDTVDNIPGAPGIGVKTAVKLMNQFGSLNGLLKNPDAILSSGMRGAKKIHQTICDHEEDIRIFRKITGIQCDIDLDVKLKDLKRSAAKRKRIDKFCDEMRFGSGIRNKLDKVGIQ